MSLSIEKIFSNIQNTKELQEEFLSPEAEAELAESYKDYKEGNYTVLKTKTDIRKHLSNLHNKV